MHNLGSKHLFLSYFIPTKWVSTLVAIKGFVQCHGQARVMTIVIGKLNEWQEAIQFPFCSSMHAWSISSKVLIIHSNRLSVCRWYAMLRLILVLKAFCNAVQNLEVNQGSLFDTTHLESHVASLSH